MGAGICFFCKEEMGNSGENGAIHREICNKCVICSYTLLLCWSISIGTKI